MYGDELCHVYCKLFWRINGIVTAWPYILISSPPSCPLVTMTACWWSSQRTAVRWHGPWWVEISVPGRWHSSHAGDWCWNTSTSKIFDSLQAYSINFQLKSKNCINGLVQCCGVTSLPLSVGMMIYAITKLMQQMLGICYSLVLFTKQIPDHTTVLFIQSYRWLHATEM